MKESKTLNIEVDKKKGIISIILAFAIFIICAIGYSLKAGVLFALGFAVIGFLKISSSNCSINIAFSVGYIGLSAVAVCWLSQMLMDFNSLWDLGVLRVSLSAIFICVLVILLQVILLDHRFAICICGTILMLLTTANHYVYEFQGNELSPLTFLSAGTAANVISNYTFTFPAPLVYSWIIWILWVVLGFSLPKITVRNQLLSRGILLIIGAIGIILWNSGTDGTNPETWGRSGTIKNGFILNFSIELKSAFVKKPDGYSVEAVDKLEQQYSNYSTNSSGNDYPDIIVIMSEAFADLSVLGSTVNTDAEVTPFYSALTENTIRGYALSSVYGGMTANSEFEFLTGNSMAFLPTASVPYQQYIAGEQYSLVSVMKEVGYRCFATHPFRASGWSRERIYSSMSFDTVTFEESYPQKNMVRDLVSDQEMYEYIIAQYEKRDASNPFFLFGITMQNHGGYAVDGFESTIHLEGYASEYPEVEQYLSLLNQSDAALEYLITYLEAIEDDVIVVFFGDHLPDLPMEFYQEVHGGEFATLEEQMLTYTVPFFIWANYDISEQTINCSSLNYIANHLLEVAGIELPPYYQFLSDMESIIPAMNANGFYSAEKGSFVKYEDAVGIESEWLKNYAILQYNNLFDSENMSTLFFETMK